MRSRIRIRVNEGAVHVAFVGAESAYKDDACIAVRFNAPRSRVDVLAVGREAVVMSSQLEDVAVGARSDGGPTMRLVRVADAPWWNEGRLRTPLGFSPSAHHGEVLVVWPFSAQTFSHDTAALMLDAVLVHAVQRHVGGGEWRVMAYRYWAPVDLRFDDPLESDAQRDDLVRALWAISPVGATLDGCSLALVAAPGLSQVTWGDWAFILVWTFGHGAMYRMLVSGSASAPRVAVGGLLLAAVFATGSFGAYKHWYFRKRD